MGKAIPKIIKQRAKDLIKLYKDSFSGDFEKNKTFINTFSLPWTKTERNLVAGFITRLYSRKSN